MDKRGKAASPRPAAGEGGGAHHWAARASKALLSPITARVQRSSPIRQAQLWLQRGRSVHWAATLPLPAKLTASHPMPPTMHHRNLSPRPLSPTPRSPPMYLESRRASPAYLTPQSPTTMPTHSSTYRSAGTALPGHQTPLRLGHMPSTQLGITQTQPSP